jgi:hypothetical protein
MLPVTRSRSGRNHDDDDDNDGATVVVSARSAVLHDEPYAAHLDGNGLYKLFMAQEFVLLTSLDKDVIVCRLTQPRVDVLLTSADVIKDFNDFCCDVSWAMKEDIVMHTIMPYLAGRDSSLHIFRIFNVWQNNFAPRTGVSCAAPALESDFEKHVGYTGDLDIRQYPYLICALRLTTYITTAFRGGGIIEDTTQIVKDTTQIAKDTTPVVAIRTFNYTFN